MSAATRVVVAAVVTAGLAAAPGADAARARTETKPYTGTLGVAGVGNGIWRTTQHDIGAARFLVQRRETRMDVSVTDASGLPLAFSVYQDYKGEQTPDALLGEHCGRTKAPIRLKADRGEVYVFVLAGACGGTPVVPTTGTATARLY